MTQVLVLSWAITASFAMLMVNIPISVGMWHAGDAARVIFQQVSSTSCLSASKPWLPGDWLAGRSTSHGLRALVGTLLGHSLLYSPMHAYPLKLCLNTTAAQDEDVCVKTATFCRFMIPGLFPWSLVTILMKVCAGCKFALASTVCNATLLVTLHGRFLIDACHI